MHDHVDVGDCPVIFLGTFSACTYFWLCVPREHIRSTRGIIATWNARISVSRVRKIDGHNAIKSVLEAIIVLAVVGQWVCFSVRAGMILLELPRSLLLGLFLAFFLLPGA